MRLFLTLSLLVMFHIKSFSQLAESKIETIRDNVFNAMTNADSIQFFASVSPNFKLMRDQGQVMTRHDLWEFIKAMKAKGVKHRLEVFDNMLIREEGSTAWMIYRYKNIEDHKSTHHYLEVAIFINQGGEWKMELAHYSKVPEKENNKN